MSEYITPNELRFGVNLDALAIFTDDEKEDAIRAASAELDDATGSRYAAPFQALPESLKVHVARAAVFHLFSARGFSPQGDDGLLERNYDRALKYFKSVGIGSLTPAPIDTSPAASAVPALDSEYERGFARRRV